MQKMKKVLASALAFGLITSSVGTINVYADAMPIVTIGADLSQEQKDKVMSFFGVESNEVQVIEINNTMERQYLEGLVPDSVIGTRTISCSYTMPTTSGGIVVKTANLNWVSDGMLANALLTSGIENCQVLATAPFEVSGTGALTGVFKAYETSSESELDEDKKQLATEELIVTGDLVSEIVDKTEEDNETIQSITEAELLALLNDIKSEVINGDLTTEDVKAIVDKHLETYKDAITEETYNQLIEYLTSLSQADYSEKIKDGLNTLSETIKEGFDIEGTFDALGVDFDASEGGLKQFFINIINWFKELFGILDETDEQGEADSGSIFSNVNTDEIQYDDGVGDKVTEQSEDNTVENNEESEGNQDDQ